METSPPHEDHEDAAGTLQRFADRVASMIVTSSYSDLDCALAEREARMECLRLLPDKMELFDRIYRAVEPEMVIHGGTGLSDETFHRLIEMGASKVNVSTQLKHAVFDSTRAFLAAATKPDPIKMHKAQRAFLAETVAGFIKTFQSDGKA